MKNCIKTKDCSKFGFTFLIEIFENHRASNIRTDARCELHDQLNSTEKTAWKSLKVFEYFKEP